MNQILINVVENGYVVTAVNGGQQRAYVVTDEDELVELVEAIVAEFNAPDDVVA